MANKKGFKFIAVAIKWFDKANGNTYFSVQVTRVWDKQRINIPFQYGYGTHYRDITLKVLRAEGWLPPKYLEGNGNLNHYESDNGYPIFWHEQEGLKRECREHGQYGEGIPSRYGR